MQADVAARLARAYTAVKYAAEKEMSTLDALIADARERQERGDSSWHVVADHLEENGREAEAAKLRKAVAKGHEVQVADDGSFHVANGYTWWDGQPQEEDSEGLRHFVMNDGGNSYHRLALSHETTADVIDELNDHPEYQQPGWTVQVWERDEDGDEIDHTTYTSPESREVE